MNYSIINIDITTNSHKKIDTICKGMEIKCEHFDETMESLEYLMDYKTNAVIVHTNIGIENLNNYLGILHEDYENVSTPIIIISDIDENNALAFNTYEMNVIAILTYSKYHYQLKNLLQTLNQQYSESFSLTTQLKESETRNVIDPLTGSFNRYGAIDIFNTLAAREKAYEEEFSLIMLDIDHFKDVNDTYGHDVGDEVLVSIASLLKDSIRGTDSLVRFGGEEFLIFISKANLQGAVNIAEKFRSLIKEIKHSSQNISLTCSFGVSLYRTGLALDALIKETDTLLYQAKDSGRDRVLSSINGKFG